MVPLPRKRGQIQPKIELPDLASDLAGPAGAVRQAQIDRCLLRAAGIVEGFAETTALSVLDACLAAAKGIGAPQAQLAGDLCNQTASLQGEIESFLGYIDDRRTV